MSNISTIFWREAIKIFRSKSQLFSSIIQPILWLALYGISLNSFLAGMPVFTGFSYFSSLVPGVITLTVLFTSLFGGIGILFDKVFGLIKEIAVAPIARTDIIIGKALGSQLRSIIQVILVLIGGFILGASFTYPYTPVLAYLGLLGLIFLMGLSFTFFSSMIAIKLTSFEGLNAIMSLLTMPLFFTSGALVPIPAMPAPIQFLSYINPVTYTVEGIKAFLLPYTPGFSMMSPELMIPISFSVLIGFTIVTLVGALYLIKRTVLI